MSKHPIGSAISVWDQQASGYDESHYADPVYCSCLELVVQAVPKGSSLCLDAGCGTGLSTVLLTARSETVVALDYSFESLKILKSKDCENVLAIQADLTALPFKASVFDACVCANTLQHLRPNAPQIQALSELRRVTKDKGILSVSTHHYSKAKQRAGWIKEGKPGQAGIDYIYRFTRSELFSLMPRSRISGIGYYSLLKIPVLGIRFQNLFGALFGKIAALAGYGHMLLAVGKNNAQNIAEENKLH